MKYIILLVIIAAVYIATLALLKSAEAADNHAKKLEEEKCEKH